MALERVQLLKQESAALGGDASDEVEYPSPLNPTEDCPEVRGLYIEHETSARDSKALISRTGPDMTFKDETSPGGYTLLQLAASAAGISEAQHEALDDLAHAIDENSFDEFLYTGNRCDSIITWTSPAKTLKIREELFTYTGSQCTQIVTIQYDGAGAEKERNTEVLAYTGNKLDNDTRTHV